MKVARIVHLTSAHEPFDIRIFHKECRSLAGAGYDITLVAPHGKNEIVDGVRIRGLPLPGGKFSRATRTAWKVFREAMGQGAEVYHFHDPELIPGGLLLRISGKKVIYDVHENHPRNRFFSKYSIPGWHWRPLGWLSWLMEHIEHFSARRFSAIVTADDELLKRFYVFNDRTIPIQNYPLQEELLSRPIGEDSRYTSGRLVSFGGIAPRASIRELVVAISLLPEGLNARLILGGDATSEALRSEVSQMPGWERVEYRGMIPRREMVDLLARAAAAVILFSPSLNSLDVRSNRLFEAMGAGLPVITSNFPKWKEFVEGNRCGLTVDPKNPQAIAEAFAYILTHPGESAAMGSRGRQLILERFNWAQEEKKLLGLYADILCKIRSQELSAVTQGQPPV